MTYVSVVTLVAYGLLIAVLVAVAVKDWRTRRIPNGMVGLLGLLWVVWRCVLGFAGKHMGLGFWSTLLSPAPEVLGRIGLPIYGVSLSGGVLGALVLGGGMLVLSAVPWLGKRTGLSAGRLRAQCGLCSCRCSPKPSRQAARRPARPLPRSHDALRPLHSRRHRGGVPFLSCPFNGPVLKKSLAIEGKCR